MDKAKDEPATASITADEAALNKVINQGIKFEETPITGVSSAVSPSPIPPPPPTIDTHGSGMVIEPKFGAKLEEKKEELPTIKPPSSLVGTLASTSSPAVSGDLENIKKSALEDLRPLVDKLGLNPEEKYDTLLLIIRSTDDKSLLQSLHEAAKMITDDTKRAQALLDVIKEVDYFSNKT